MENPLDEAAHRLAGLAVLPDGELQVRLYAAMLGRADDQVKIDGYRVEPSELEAVLAQAPGVRAAVATTIDTPSGRALAAAVDPAGVDVDAVWQHAATWCPRYMMPSTILSIDLPLAVSSKADRVRIREVLQQHVRGVDLPDPWTYIRTTVSRWLGRPIALDDGGLLGVGLGSLGSARLVADLVFRYQVDLELSDALAAPTLAELARQVDRRAAP